MVKFLVLDKDKKALHMVSAFASECSLVLAQTKVSDKSNEIIAIPVFIIVIRLRGDLLLPLMLWGAKKKLPNRLLKNKAITF